MDDSVLDATSNSQIKGSEGPLYARCATCRLRVTDTNAALPLLSLAYSAMS